MLRKHFWIVLSGAVALVWALSEGAAQEPKERAPAEAKTGEAGRTPGNDRGMPAAAAGGSKSALRDAIYILDVLDLEGRVRGKFLPNWTDEDLKKLLDRALAGPRPARVTACRLSGDVTGDHARMLAELTAYVDGEEAVRIPLGLGGVYLESAREGERDADLAVEGEGYVWRTIGKGAHKLAVQFQARLQTAGAERRLSVPVAGVPVTELELIVAGRVASASAGENVPIEVQPAAGEKTRLRAWPGPRRQLELAWQVRSEQVASGPATLAVSGELAVHIDNRFVTTQATFEVRALQGEAATVVLRLPTESQLLFAGPPPGAEANGSQDAIAIREKKVTSDGGRPMVTLTLGEPITQKRRVVRLVTQRPLPAQDTPFSLSGFEWFAALQQSGVIAVQLVGDQRVRLVKQDAVTQIDIAELPGRLRANNSDSAFRYWAQPFDLQVAVSEIQPLVQVKPTTVVVLEPGTATFYTRLDYAIRRRGVFQVRVALGPDVQIDQVGPAAAVADFEQQVAEGERRLIVTLAGRTGPGPLRLELRGRREIEIGKGTLSLEAPRPLDAVVEDGVLALVAAANLEVRPRLDLAPEAQPIGRAAAGDVVVPGELPARAQEPLFYRYPLSSGRMVVEARARPRKVRVDSTAAVTIAGRQVEVEQRLHYQAEFGALGTLRVRVPAEVAKTLVMEDSTGAAIRPQLEEPATEGERERGLVAVVSGLGSAASERELVARYRVALESGGDAEEQDQTVPLVVPLEGEPGQGRVEVYAEPQWDVTVGEGPWEAVALRTRVPKPGVAGPRLVLATRERADSVPLVVTQRELEAAPAVRVARALVETAVGQDGVELCRARFAVTECVTDQLEVSLPAEAALDEMRVDGAVVRPERLGEAGRFRVGMAQGARGRPLVVEVMYRRAPARPLGLSGELELSAPQLAGDPAVGRTYWQVALPERQVLIADPAAFVGEQDWTREGWFWVRRARLSSPELEAWLGAPPAAGGTRTLSELPKGGHVYLYSRVGGPNRLKLSFAGQPLVLAAGSGVALLIGLVLIYLPARYRVGVAGAAVFGGVIVAGLAPTQTVLLAQGGQLGVLLAVLAGVAEWWVNRRPGRQVILYTEASSFTARPSSVAPRLMPPPTEGSTTAASQIPVEAPS